MSNSRQESEKLIKEHYSLVPQVASRYRSIRAKDPDFYQDILQEGTLGLIESARRFDKGRGVFFYFYARKRIKDSINSYLRKNSNLVHVPTNILYESFKLKRLLRNDISHEEILIKMNCNEERLQKIIDISNIQLLDIGRNDAIYYNTVNDVIEKIDGDKKREFIQKILKTFDPQIQSIFNKRFSQGLSWRKIGGDLGISHEKARSLFNDHVDLIKKQIKDNF